MAVTNHERVGKTLTLVRDGLLPSLERTWRGVYGDDWIQKVNELERHPDRAPSKDDLMFLLKGMWNSWNAVFREQFGPSERNYVSELRTARNKWAHNEQFSTDDTYRVLDTAERLLQSLSAAEQVTAVRTAKQDLLRTKYAEEARSEHRRLATAPTKGEPVAGLAPWREVITPHPDVAQGRYQQAEFAADLYQVATEMAADEYQDPVAFYRRTFITEGLKDLLVNAARRLSGDGGDPVVELQTNFGGGKTHSLIALHHLVGGTPAVDLPGVAEVLVEDELTIPSKVSTAVFVGQMTSPASVHEKPDGTKVHTLWGELAWQLGGADAYAMIAEADQKAKNPGNRLIKLFQQYGPALVLIDEWVAYARQLPNKGHSDLPAGDFDTQFTFAQALTEATSAVDNVLVLVAIPSSDIEVGGERGREALIRLKDVVSRKALQWQPATADESFEIVRRRLFEPLAPDNARARDAVVKAFCNAYRENPDEYPSETKEGEYRRRMEAAYPVHPELFDRLYSDWSTLDRFQRTRGILRLMATVISELWRRDDRNLLIMPGTLPMDASSVVSELTNKYLEEGWEPVLRSDVDGPNSLPLRLDQQFPNLGRLSAVRRVARTVYLGSAPRAEGRKGIDIKKITLGATQPGESPGVFGDGLRRLSGAATYLYVDGAQYWYSLQPNVTRLAQDRATSNYTDDDADIEIRNRLQADRAKGPFGAVHVFPEGPGDVPDEEDCVRLIVLPLQTPHVSSSSDSAAIQASEAILQQRSGGPRINRNLLVVLAADKNRVEELRGAARQYLAWKSIVGDKEELNLNPHQLRQAETKRKEADETAGHRIGETFRLVLTPAQDPGSAELEWRQTRVSSSGGLADRVARKLESDESLIASYGGIRVRMDLDKIPLWSDRGDREIRELWSYYAQYPYLPRLAHPEVLTRAIENGVQSLNWEKETFAYAEAYDEEHDRYLGLKTAELVSVGSSQTALVIQPERAKQQILSDQDEAGDEEKDDDEYDSGNSDNDVVKETLYKRFYARKDLDPVRAIRDLESVLENVVKQLDGSDASRVKMTLEIEAEAAGFDDRIRRTVSENATQLGFDRHEFEE